MGKTILTQQTAYPVVVLGPSTDLYNTNPRTTPLDRSLFDHVTYFIIEGAGGVGTAKIQAEAVTRVAAGLDPQLLPFFVRASPAASHVLGALSEISDAVAGYTSVAGANKLIVVEVQLYGDDSHPGTSLKFTEVANDPVVGVVLAVLTRGRYGFDAPPKIV